MTIDTNELKISELRKKEHIKYFLESTSNNDNYYKDIIIQNNSLPEIDFNEIDTSCFFLNKKVNFPIMINAITGGTEEAILINENLAGLAKKFGIPIAVGSQSMALKNSKYNKSYRVVRDIMKDGLVISNLSASRSCEDVVKVIDMLEADAVQLHLNAAQEICMSEGDRNFKGILNNIENIVKKLNKPVIVKEVGFGISKKVAKQLIDVGVNYIDIGGKGGTNFIEIEDLRNPKRDFSELYSWGIPTASSLLQCCSITPKANIICSGGITTAEEIVKSLCVGADIVGLSGIILKTLLSEGCGSCESLIEDLTYKIKVLMLLVGAKNIADLKEVPYIIKGELKELTKA